MSDIFIRQAIDGGDLGVWAYFENSNNSINLALNTTYLYLDGSDLKLSIGKIGLDDSSGKGIINVVAARTISVAGLTASRWARVEVNRTGTTPSYSITSIAAASSASVLPTSEIAAYDGGKGGYYLTATKRILGFVWINAGGNVEGIVNMGNGDMYNGYAVDEVFASGKSASFAPVPPGSMIMYGGATAPNGWLLCDGSAVSRTTYAALFAAISTTFGAGDTTTTFNVPDFRGIYPKGAGTTTRAAGKDANGNAYAATLGAYTQDKMQGHKHETIIEATAARFAVAGAAGTAGAGDFKASTSATACDGNDQLVNANIPIADGTNGTPRTGMTTEPQNLGVTFIIKY